MNKFICLNCILNQYLCRLKSLSLYICFLILGDHHNIAHWLLEERAKLQMSSSFFLLCIHENISPQSSASFSFCSVYVVESSSCLHIKLQGSENSISGLTTRKEPVGERLYSLERRVFQRGDQARYFQLATGLSNGPLLRTGFVSACMCVYVYVYTHVYTHTHIHAYRERQPERQRQRGGESIHLSRFFILSLPLF